MPINSVVGFLFITKCAEFGKLFSAVWHAVEIWMDSEFHRSDLQL